MADAELRAAIRQAEADTDTSPTEAQAQSGNYRKGRFAFHGLTVVVENPKGSIRRGVGPDGVEWQVTMPATYGYIARTEGEDGDQVDVYIGPEPESEAVFIVYQIDIETRAFDEHKILLGYPDVDTALADYDAGFSDGRGPERRGVVQQTTIAFFKDWLKYNGMNLTGADTREFTKEGMMRADAVLTRAGPIVYSRGELGLDGDPEEAFTVHRTLDTLRHPETIASLRGAPITVGHPDGGVTPDNWQDTVVGAVAGEPEVKSNTIVGKVLVGDKDALKRLDDGEDEVSIGYAFTLGENGDTLGPLKINHVAIVPRGRAGSSVRVLDQATRKEDMPEFSKKDLQDAFTDGLDAWMQKNKDNASGIDEGSMKKAFGDALADAMKPFGDALAGIKDAQDAATKAAADEAEKQRQIEAKDAAQKAADELVEATRKEERERFAIITDALPLIAEDKRAAVMDMDPHAILVEAVGDSIPNADKQSVEFLRGIVTMLGKQTEATDTLPAGVVPFTPRATSATDAREDAQKKFLEAQADRYSKAGGV